MKEILEKIIKDRKYAFLAIGIIIIAIVLSFGLQSQAMFADIPRVESDRYRADYTDKEAELDYEKSLENEARNRELSAKSNNSYLQSLEISNGKLNKIFDKQITDYIFELDDGVKEIEIIAKAEDDSAKIEGAGVFRVESLDREHKIFVRSESGNVQIYTIKFVNKKDSDKLISIEIYGINNGKEKRIQKNNWNTPFSPDIFKYDINTYDVFDDYRIEANASKYSNVKIEKNINNRNCEIKVVVEEKEDINDNNDKKVKKTNTYIFNIEYVLEDGNNKGIVKSLEKLFKNSWLIYICATLIILVILVWIIKRRKKKH